MEWGQEWYGNEDMERKQMVWELKHGMGQERYSSNFNAISKTQNHTESQVVHNCNCDHRLTSRHDRNSMGMRIWNGEDMRIWNGDRSGMGMRMRIWNRDADGVVQK